MRPKVKASTVRSSSSSRPAPMSSQTNPSAANYRGTGLPGLSIPGYTPQNVLRPSVSGGGGAPAPQQQQQNFSSAPMQDTPGFEAPDYDSIINPVIQSLDAAIAPLQQGYEADVSGINQRKQTGIQSVNQGIGEQSATLDRSRQSQMVETENSVNEQRRGLSEVQQGLQARYGGGSGIGAFASEYAGGQALRNIGNIRTTLSQNLQEIDNKLLQVKEIGRIALMDLEDKAADQTRMAKAQLDQALQQIRLQKGELQSRKAEMASQALQMYQQTVQQIKASNTTFQQQLYAQQLAAEQSLSQALKTGQNAIGNLQLGSLTGPLGQKIIGGLDKKTGNFYEKGSATPFNVKPNSTYAPLITNLNDDEKDKDGLYDQ